MTDINRSLCTAKISRPFSNVLLAIMLPFLAIGHDGFVAQHYGTEIRLSGWQEVPQILKRISPPKFPDRSFVITDYGAVPGGKVLCTAAFEKAIDVCNKSGGGHVVVPSGVFLTGAIHLKSNVDLHISRGAIVKFSTNPKDYLPIVLVRWEGSDVMNYSPLIYANGQENIALTGEGVLDGQADSVHWWNWKDLSNTPGSRPRLMKLNDENVPVDKRIFGEGYYLRPSFVEFYRCKNVLIKGISLKDSPFWFLHPILCSNVTIEGVSTNSSGPNTDGCDPESCNDVLIQKCVFNDGDDCIAIKSGRNNDGRRTNVPAKNIVIRDCTMRDGHGGISIGSEITGGCQNVFVVNCQLSSPNLDEGIRIKSNAKRGGVIENIYARNLDIGEVRDAIVRITMNYDPKEADAYSYYPTMRNIFVENVTSQRSTYALYFDGLPQSEIENVIIKDCNFNGVRSGNRITYTTGLRFIHVRMNGEPVNEP
jgi:polygalacturonase